MEFRETKDKLVIELTPPKKSAAKVILYIQMAIFIGLTVFLFIRLLSSIKDNFGMAFILLIVVFIGILLIGRKFFGTVFHREILEVTAKQLTVIDDYLFSKKVETFSIPKISSIKFVGENQFTKHPLEGESMDYTGLGVRERIVQSVISDGTIGISYNGRTRKFGKNLPSWDAEEVVTRIVKFTGNDFSSVDEMQRILEDFEKNNSKD